MVKGLPNFGRDYWPTEIRRGVARTTMEVPLGNPQGGPCFLEKCIEAEAGTSASAWTKRTSS